MRSNDSAREAGRLSRYSITSSVTRADSISHLGSFGRNRGLPGLRGAVFRRMLRPFISMDRWGALGASDVLLLLC